MSASRRTDQCTELGVVAQRGEVVVAARPARRRGLAVDRVAEAAQGRVTLALDGGEAGERVAHAGALRVGAQTVVEDLAGAGGVVALQRRGPEVPLPRARLE